MALTSGTKLGPYEIISPLGAGGMGEVYRARDIKLGRDVAIKVLPTDRPFSQNSRLRFQREAMTASALNHPNIITIYEINSEGNLDFIVMEYVRGSTLAARQKKTRLSVPQVLRYCVQIADAVAKAHGAGIIHRDLKPGNVMITEDGLVKVLDFGLAKFNRVLGSESDETAVGPESPEMNLTIPGATTGTLAYMSPEQARGDAVDFRTDIFSFGTVMFQLLSGELPFPGPNTMAAMHNLHFNPPQDLARLCPEVPKSLARLILKMLEKDRAKRIQSMAEVANELRAIARAEQCSLSQESAIAPTVAGLPPSLPPGIGRFRGRGLWVAIGLLVVIAVAALVTRQMLKKSVAPASSASEEQPVEDNSYALYKRAREYLDHYHRGENVDRAIKLLERAVQLEPKSAASYAALSEAYNRKNGENPDPQWIKLAAQYAKRSVELDNDLALGHIVLGITEMKLGHAAEAEKQLQLAATLDPKSEAGHRWLAWLYDKTDRQKQAAEELQRALQLDPNNWQVHMEMGLNAYLAANYSEAAAHWERALSLEPDNVLALRNLGAVYHMLDRDDDAANALQRALAIQPNADVYNNLGTIRFYQGRYQDAVPAFEKTVALAANNYDNWGSLADAYRWTPGNQAKALQAYQHAIQLIREDLVKSPKNLDMRATLATYLAKAGDKTGALRELASVEAAGKKEGLTWFRMAIVYELCGDRARALGALSSAVEAGQNITDIKNEPELTSLRADPAYHLRILAAAKAEPGKH